MENKKLINIEQKNIEYSKELLLKRKEIMFDTLLIEYKNIKKQEYNITKEISENRDSDNIKNLEDKFQRTLVKKKEILKKFKEVEKFEQKIYLLRKSLILIIVNLDKQKNNNDYIIQSLKNRNTKELKITDPKYSHELEQKNAILLKEIEEIEMEIKRLLSFKKPVNYLRFQISSKKSEISKNKISIKKTNNVNLEMVNKIITKNDKIIQEKNSISQKFAKEIDFATKLIEKIDDSLSSKEDDEINNNNSFTIKYLNAHYGNKQALFNINLEIPKNKIIAIIGPSGCGKSTFLRTLNRINDNLPTYKATGKILLDGEYDIFKLRSIKNRYDKIELSTLRTRIGMIFQQPNPFPMSITKNVQYGPRVKGIKNRALLNDLTEISLKKVGLWEEVKDNLKSLGTSLSGGQQQRLCIARAIANEPEILLMDEPTSALDPIAAKKIEELIVSLKKEYTIIMVTHSMQQAQRISDLTAFFYQGELIEYDTTQKIFNTPNRTRTKEYISGKFG